MNLLHKLVTRSLHYNIVFEAQHIQGLKNVIADKLSRFQLQDLQILAPPSPNHGSSDTRLPVTYSILQQLVRSLQYTCNSHFFRIVFKAMYLVAFYSFLRIGEITKTNSEVQNNITFEEVKFLFHKSASIPHSFEIYMSNFNNVDKASHILLISETSQRAMCPVSALWEFCLLRGTYSVYLFCFMNGDPIPRQFFNQYLRFAFT